MDFLKEAISSRKKEVEELKKIDSLSSGSNKKKWVRKRDLNEAQLKKQELEEESQQERKQKKRKIGTLQSDSKNDSNSTENNDVKDKNDDSLDNDLLNIPKKEVFRLLRMYDQPVTLFGETNDMRVKRLRIVQEHLGERIKGQENEFKQVYQKREAELLNKQYGGENTEDGGENTQQKKVENKKRSRLDELESIDDLAKMNEVVSPDEFIRLTIKFLLIKWTENIENLPADVRKSQQGKKDATICNQTQLYVRPLLKKLKKHKIGSDVSEKLYEICLNLSQRNYRRANDIYLQLSIGNAPWPMGVTMVGIHARSAREKIGSDKVAHILNDEEQRKYIQSMKRLMTFCQKIFVTSRDKIAD